MAAKGAFNPSLGEDIDDLLPPKQQLEPPPGARPATAVVNLDQPPAATPPVLEEHPKPANRTAAAAASHASEITVATASISAELHKRLIRLAAREKAKDATAVRSYGQVVLDAVESHQDELAQHWYTDAEAAQGSGGLFRRQRPVKPVRRRRHPEPPARIPLNGVSAEDIATLDRLAVDWNAGSRSALVEEALRLYLS